MLSRKEKEFLRNPDAFKLQARDIRYRIRKKMEKFAKDLELILSNYESAGIDISVLASVMSVPRMSQNSTTGKEDDLSYLENW